MKRRFLVRIAVPIVWLIINLACAAKSLDPGADRVVIGDRQPPASCKFIGTLVAQQGGAWSGFWTSNRNLAQGALNELRNEAHSMGANYVLILNTTAGATGGVTATGGALHQTDVTHTASAYRCPPDEIGLQ